MQKSFEEFEEKAGSGDGSPEVELRNGIPLLQRRPGVVVTNELIDRLREAEGV